MKENEINLVPLYMFGSLSSLEAILDTWTLKISLARDVNDPTENIPQLSNDQNLFAYWESFKDKLTPYFCFSRDGFSPQMWTNYADASRGFCLKFLFPLVRCKEKVPPKKGEKDKRIAYQLLPMVKKNLNLNQTDLPHWENIYYTEDRPIVDLSENDEEIKRSIDCMLFYKGKDWSYEEEVRCLCSPEMAVAANRNCITYSWPLRFLKSIYLGSEADCSVQYIKTKLNMNTNRTAQISENWLMEMNLIDEIEVEKMGYDMERYLFVPSSDVETLLISEKRGVKKSAGESPKNDSMLITYTEIDFLPKERTVKES